MSKSDITGADTCGPVPSSEVDWSKRRLSGRYVAETDDSVGGCQVTLHIDIDGPKPLGVLSGTIRKRRPGAHPIHFCQRGIKRRVNREETEFIANDLSLEWPGRSTLLTTVELRIKHPRDQESQPQATVRFGGSGKPVGPLTLRREGPWFRTVEIQIDHESGVDVPLPPYASCTHPDRPPKLVDQPLTLDQVFADAGIRLLYTNVSRQISSEAAGEDHEWSQRELHDSMSAHWEAFANRPQWKMWVLLAKKSERSGLGGLMFDTNIDEPGGVDRQGTALFTGCEYFFSPKGLFCTNNPPAESAAERELFFTLVHEIGHAFNLVHPAERGAGQPWRASTDSPNRPNQRALTFMNYPNLATPKGLGGANATWFYSRFGFMFDRPELLHLRHAPERDVQMGGTSWGTNSARFGGPVEPQLHLQVRSRKRTYELGERVILELKLKNVGPQPITIHDQLHPNEGFVHFAVTDPEGHVQRHRPLQQTLQGLAPQELVPGQAIYQRVNLTIGLEGFIFKRPGKYRIDARYLNLDGKMARGHHTIEITSSSTDHQAAVSELFDARVGRVLYVEGTRFLDEVNEKLDWVRDRLGRSHPASIHLATVRFWPLAHDGRYVDPATGSFKLAPAEPDRALDLVSDLVGERAAEAADTLGHIGYRRLVDRYANAAVQAGRRDHAIEVERRLSDLFSRRGVLPTVIDAIEARLEEFGA